MFERGRPIVVAALGLILVIAVSGCGGGDGVSSPSTGGSAGTATEEATAEHAADLAPEFASVEGWYNSEPLTLEALRGSPVLLVFWSDT